MRPDHPPPAGEQPDETLDPMPALTEEQYLAEVLRSAPPPETITFPSDSLVLGALGLAGEAGEVADLVKKHCFHDHPLDREHLLDELGDVLWYLTWLCHTLNTSLGAVMLGNVTKLRARYPHGFDPQRSQQR